MDKKTIRKAQEIIQTCLLRVNATKICFFVNSAPDETIKNMPLDQTLVTRAKSIHFLNLFRSAWAPANEVGSNSPGALFRRLEEGGQAGAALTTFLDPVY